MNEQRTPGTERSPRGTSSMGAFDRGQSYRASETATIVASILPRRGVQPHVFGLNPDQKICHLLVGLTVPKPTGGFEKI